MKTAEVRDKIIRILTQIEAKHYPYPYKKKVVDELLESYVKETAIEFAKNSCNESDTSKQREKEWEEFYTDWYTKHKEG